MSQSKEEISAETQRYLINDLELISTKYVPSHEGRKKSQLKLLATLKHIVLDGDQKQIRDRSLLQELLKRQRKPSELEELKQVEDILISDSTSYVLLKAFGKGCFGTVFRCQNRTTKERVAMKIYNKSATKEEIDREVSMLKLVSILTKKSCHILRFIEYFTYDMFNCLVLENLDISLFDLMREPGMKPMSLNMIRPIAKQLFQALDELQAVNILHADIKPDNIMLVDRKQQPHRVKLIDFGWACFGTDMRLGIKCQAPLFRAPEVFFGLPITPAIDVWGVATSLAYLYLGFVLFNGFDAIDILYHIVKLMGQPEDDVLNAGIYTRRYFSKKADDVAWTLMKPKKRKEPANQQSPTRQLGSLDDMLHVHPMEGDAEFMDRLSFVHMLRHVLHVDWNKRIAAKQALKHSFITMQHLMGNPCDRAYLDASKAMMKEGHLFPTDRLNSWADCSPHQETTGSLDRVPVTSSNNEDPAACYSDGEVTPDCNEEDLVGSHSDGIVPPDCNEEDLVGSHSDGVVPSISYEEDPAACYSYGVVPTISNKENPAACYSDGVVPTISNKEDPAACYSDGVVPTISNKEDPAACYSYGVVPTISNKEDPAACYSDGVVPPISNKEDPAACYSDGVVPTVSNDEDLNVKSELDGSTHVNANVSGFSRFKKKLCTAVRRFVGRIKSLFCSCKEVA